METSEYAIPMYPIGPDQLCPICLTHCLPGKLARLVSTDPDRMAGVVTETVAWRCSYCGQIFLHCALPSELEEESHATETDQES